MSDSVSSKIFALPTREQKRSSTDDDAFVALPERLQLPEPDDFVFLRECENFCKRWSPRSPMASHEAIALHTLSAAAAGRVVFDYGSRNRTTLYQFLVAPSTLFAKTSVAKISDDLLEDAGLGRVTIGRATPQSFFDQCLEKVPNDYESLPDKKKEIIRERLRSAAQRAWYAEEFGVWAAAMLREGSVQYEFRTLLLQIYDSPKSVEMSTRTYGTQAMERPALSLFALSTPEDVKRIASAGSPFWRDGLLARFDWITTYDDEKHTNTMYPEGRRVSPQSLVDGLRKFDAMLGRAAVDIVPVVEKGANNKDRTIRMDVVVTPRPEFVVDLDADVRRAVAEYDAFLRDLVADGLCVDLHSSYGRMADRTLRIACLLAAYESERTCKLRHFAKARAIVERRRLFLHLTYRRLTNTAAETERVQRTDAILRYVAAGRAVSIRDIQQKFRRKYPMGLPDLKRELDTLVASGDLHCVEVGRNRKLYAVDLDSLPETTGKGAK